MLCLACNDKKAFSTSTDHIYGINFGIVGMYVTPYHRYLHKIWYSVIQKNGGIPMGTNCAPLVADLFLFCHEKDFIKYLSDNNQADIIEAFNSTSSFNYITFGPLRSWNIF